MGGAFQRRTKLHICIYACLYANISALSAPMAPWGGHSRSFRGGRNRCGSIKKGPPRGFEDAIISKMVIEKQGQLYHLSVHQRDMFSGCMTRSSEMAMYLIQQAATWIAGKMTPNSQITDTDVVGQSYESRRCEEGDEGHS